MPNQQEFAQGQIGGLSSMMADPAVLSALQQYLGSQQFQGALPGWARGSLTGQLQSQVGAGQQNNLSKFQTSPLDEAVLSKLIEQYLGGAQNRALGSAGGAAGAYAASRGLNPYSFIQHSQSPIYGQYADAFGKAATEIPQLGFQSRLAANQANYGNLAKLMGLQQGYASMLPQQGSDIGSIIGGGLGAIGGSILGPLGGMAAGKIGSSLFGGGGGGSSYGNIFSP